MGVFATKKYQRMAELLQRVEAQAEKGGGEVLTRSRDDLVLAAREGGIDLEALRLLDRATVVELVAGGASPDAGRAWAAAEVLFLDGLMAYRQGDGAGGRQLLEKAAALYRRTPADLALPPLSAPPADRLDRIDALLGT